MRVGFTILLSLLLTACATSSPPGVATGDDAYSAFAAEAAAETEPYRLGPGDTVSISVYQEPDLSKDVIIDTEGRISLPLAGHIEAAGLTTIELEREIAGRLGERYLQNPLVAVSLASSVSRKVVVEGSVKEAGVFALSGKTTLLEALAMAKGPSDVAALDNVVVFRTIDGQRMAAMFDVRAIRSGEAEDPQIQANDLVVVGLSSIKARWRDFLSAVPLLAVFRPVG